MSSSTTPIVAIKDKEVQKRAERGFFLEQEARDLLSVLDNCDRIQEAAPTILVKDVDDSALNRIYSAPGVVRGAFIRCPGLYGRLYYRMPDPVSKTAVANLLVAFQSTEPIDVKVAFVVYACLLLYFNAIGGEAFSIVTATLVGTLLSEELYIGFMMIPFLAKSMVEPWQLVTRGVSWPRALPGAILSVANAMVAVFPNFWFALSVTILTLQLASLGVMFKFQIHNDAPLLLWSLGPSVGMILCLDLEKSALHYSWWEVYCECLQLPMVAVGHVLLFPIKVFGKPDFDQEAPGLIDNFLKTWENPVFSTGGCHFGRTSTYPTAAALVRTESKDGDLCRVLEMEGPHLIKEGSVHDRSIFPFDSGTTAYHWLA